MSNKYMITQGGALKTMDGIKDSWDFVEAQKTNGDAELYAKVSAVYRAANLTADATSNMPFAVMKGDNDVDTSTRWENIIGIMPNPRELIRLWRMSLFFTNTAYGRIAKTNAIKRRIFYINPQTMKIVTDSQSGEVKEIIRNNKETYNPDDKTLFKMWRLDYTTELLPSNNTEFKAMSQSAGILFSSDFWARNYFKNGAVKPGIVSIKGMVLGDKKDELQTSWGKFIRGIGSTFSELVKVINGDTMDYKSIGDGLGDIKDSPVYKQAIENIAMASGMPLSLLLSNSANYATAQSEYATWFRDSITPWAMWIHEELNNQILIPAGLHFEFRPEQSEPNQQEEVERASAFSTYVSSGIKPSVAAQIVGIDLPNGIEYDDLDPEEPAQQPAQSTTDTAKNTPAQSSQMESDMEDAGTNGTAAELDTAQKGMTFDAWQELDIWKRKAVKAEKRGEALPIDFECKHIPSSLADTVRNLLQREEIGAAFSMNYAMKKDEPTTDAPPPKPIQEIKDLAAALDRAAIAAIQPTVKAEPKEDKQMLSIKADNVTVQNDEAVKVMQLMTAKFEQMAQTVPQIIVNVPEQPAPVVNFTMPEIPAAVVNVSAPIVNVPEIKLPPVVVNMPERKPITAEITTDKTGKKIMKVK